MDLDRRRKEYDELKQRISLAHTRTNGFESRGFWSLSEFQFLAFLASVACFMALVDAAVQQLQMYFLGGHIVFGSSLLKAALILAVLLGFMLRPKLEVTAVPLLPWMLCIGFLAVEILYLTFSCGMSPGNVILSYYDYYFLLMVGPALVVFQGGVPEKTLIRSTILIFAVCASFAAAQYLTSRPILYTESVDGSFKVSSWEFIGQVRAFSLFQSALEFGLFAAFCGALGIALAKTMPLKGTLLVIASGLACYTTLTRLCYLIFFCACAYSAVITFGRKSFRGRWHPLIYFMLGLATIFIGLTSFTSGEANKLQDAGSIFQRIEQWNYYYDLLLHSSLSHQLFGLGIVQNETVYPQLEKIIDNTLLALTLHVGLVGLTCFGILLTRMWIYLRSEALATQQPFIIAAASLWATFACAGTFNIVFASFGTVFALAVLCERKEKRLKQQSLCL